MPDLATFDGFNFLGNIGNTKSVRRGLRFKPFGSPGQYDVRIRRTTADPTDSPDDTDRTVDKAFWTCLRTIKYQNPVNLKGMALIALRIKATDQLNGVVDQFNCIAHSILPAWNGFSWITQTTSNPAAIYRNILQGTANARPLVDSRLDLPTIQQWSEDCDVTGRACNLIIDYQTSVFEALRQVAATGRASFDLRDGKYSVIQDKPQDSIVQLFTPRNSREFSGHKVFVDLPHALKINFVNEQADWKNDELLVFADGFDLTTATKFDTLDLIGITNPDQVWKDGRYHIAQATLRPEVYELTVDIENLIVTRGDLVGVVHDVPRFGLGAGRIKSVTLNGSNEATSIVVDNALVMDEAFRYVVRYRRNDSTMFLKEIVSVTGEQTTFAFIENIPEADVPQEGNLIAYGELGSEAVRLLVKSIEPRPNLEAKLTLLDEAPGIHTADTQPIPPHSPQISIPIQQRAPLPPIVDEVISDERALVRDMDGSFRSRILIRMHYVSGIVPAKRVEVRYHRSDSTESWSQIAALVNGDADEIEIPQVIEHGKYDILIRAVSKYEVYSVPISILGHIVTGRTTPPPDVVTVTIEGHRLSWAYPAPPLDFLGYAVRMQFGQRNEWNSAMPLHDGMLTQSFLDLSNEGGIRTYLVKAIDTAKYESVRAASLLVDWGNRPVDNVVETVDYQALGFPGMIVGGSVVFGVLEQNADTPWWTSESDPFWTNTSLPFWGDSFEEMVYTFVYTPPEHLLTGTLFLDEVVA